jgi:NADPH:quinone reductase-like Zn-dependent oxidoreductase
MRAVVYKEYGTPEVLKLQEVDKPVPKDNEVLIKIHAASVNSWDYDWLTGRPLIYRLLFGLFKPKINILGADVSGTIEAVGSKVIKFKLGEEVFGDLSGGNWGGFSEYVCAPENSFVIKPPGITFEQVAALPQAGVMALQGIRDYGNVQSGQKVLINGGGGGMGTFAIQLGKLSGAEVTGVDSEIKLEIMRSLGADHVLDYTKEDFTESGEIYDLILDNAAHHSVFDYLKILRPGGAYYVVGGSVGRILQILFIGSWLAKIRGRKMGILAHKPNLNLSYLAELMNSGKISAVIDKQYELNEVPEAVHYFGEGKHKGKLIIKVSQ